jgi:hypothetical protein
MLKPEWVKGFTQVQLDDAQARYDLTFPPDLVADLRERRLVGGYDWSTENAAIRKMLVWPFDMLLAQLEYGYWWPRWGDRPSSAEARAEVLRKALADGFDTIYYGADLHDYWKREFGELQTPIGTVRHIPFWSDITESWEGVARYDE